MDYIISLGGSLIVPEEIDIAFLRNFYEAIVAYTRKGNRIAIITGGGRTCRKYQAAAKAIVPVADEDLDWLGIHTTRLNAHLIRTIFKKYANPVVIKNPSKKIEWKGEILVGAGWKPGCSTDQDAVLLAKNLGISTIINLTNIQQVYDHDPKKFKDAKPLSRISWKEMKSIVGSEWKPGLNAPFDPVATKEAAALGLKVVILGPDVDNLKNFLEGSSFIGTTIE